MNKRLLIAVPLALALSAGAIAKEGDYNYDRDAAVETLKSQLPSVLGFEVQDVRAGDDGVACITYHVANDNGGFTQTHAVVQGDKVYREYKGNSKFEKAWNRKCASK